MNVYVCNVCKCVCVCVCAHACRREIYKTIFVCSVYLTPVLILYFTFFFSHLKELNILSGESVLLKAGIGIALVTAVGLLVARLLKSDKR